MNETKNQRIGNEFQEITQQVAEDLTSLYSNYQFELNKDPIKTSVGNELEIQISVEKFREKTNLQAGIDLANGLARVRILQDQLPDNPNSRKICSPLLFLMLENSDEDINIPDPLADLLLEAYLTGDPAILQKRLKNGEGETLEVTLGKTLETIGKSFKDNLHKLKRPELDHQILWLLDKEGSIVINDAAIKKDWGSFSKATLCGIAATFGLVWPSLPININRVDAQILGSLEAIIAASIALHYVYKHISDNLPNDEMKEATLTSAAITHLFTNPENGKVGIGRF